MAEVGSVEFSINVNNSKANKALDESSKKIDSLAQATKDADEQTAKSAKIMGNAWDSLKGKLTGAVIIGSVVGIGKAMLNTATEFEQARGVIARGTGATGEALATLLENAKDVFKELPQSINEVADGLQDINTRFGYTGETLENAVKQFAEFAKISGQSISFASSNASKLANKWKLSGKDVYTTLDKITAVAQASGIGIGQLEAQLTESSNRLMAMGLSLDESISLLGSLEKYGANASSAIMAMSMSFTASAKTGRDARIDWQEFAEAVKNATTDTEANLIASQKLGTRYAAELLPALRQGALDFNAYAEAVKGANGITEQTYNDSLTTVEKLQIAMKTLQTTLAEIGLSILEELPQFLKETAPALKEITNALKALLPVLKDVIKVAGGAAKELTNTFTGDNLKIYATGLDEIIEKLKSGEKYKYFEFSADFTSSKVQVAIEDLIFKAQRGIITIDELKKTLSQCFGFVSIDKTAESVDKVTEATKELNQELEKTEEEIDELSQEALAEGKNIAMSIANAFTDIASSLFNMSEELGKRPLQEALKAEDKALMETKKRLEEENKLRKDALDKRSEDLDEMLDRQEISEADYLLQKEALRIEEEAEGQRALEEREKAEKQTAEKKNEIEKKMFESEKANSIAQIWLNVAKGIMAAWSSGNAVIAGITTGLITAQAGIQTGLVASQKFTPSYSTGIDKVPETGYALLHRGESVLNVADANRYRYDLGHSAQAPTQPVFNIVLKGDVSVDGGKLADIVLRNWNDSYNRVVGR